MKNKQAPSDVPYDQLLQKAEHFCAWRDRCIREVEEKLWSLGADSLQSDQIIARLCEDGFLDEPRYARSFVRGKLHNNHWGRIRMIRELQQRQLSPSIINEALEQLDPQEYQQILESVAQKKAGSLKETDRYTRNGKIAAYCINKGFEPELVWQLINKK